jgi:hypothetical protein
MLKIIRTCPAVTHPLVVSSSQNKNPKPYTDAMSVSLWTQPTNEFRFQTLFPNLGKGNF